MSPVLEGDVVEQVGREPNVPGDVRRVGEQLGAMESCDLFHGRGRLFGRLSGVGVGTRRGETVLVLGEVGFVLLEIDFVLEIVRFLFPPSQLVGDVRVEDVKQGEHSGDERLAHRRVND